MKFAPMGLALALTLQSAVLSAPHDTPALQPLGIALESYPYPYPVPAPSPTR